MLVITENQGLCSGMGPLELRKSREVIMKKMSQCVVAGKQEESGMKGMQNRVSGMIGMQNEEPGMKGIKDMKFGIKFGTFLLGLCCLIPAQNALANNIQVSNISLTGLDTGAGTILVECDVSWNNSWRDGLNWDAAWLFVKWRLNAASPWQHGNLKTSGHVAPSGAILENSDAAGAFIYRSVQGIGNVNFTNLRLLWDYGAASLTEGTDVEVSVHAIEMVYVPQGAFEAGRQAGESYFITYPNYSSSYTVNSEAAISVGNQNGRLYSGGNNRIDNDALLPAAWPKGYNAFYCMKYELSQGQYADFLNKLTSVQAGTRDYTHTGTPERYTIASGAWPNYVATAPNRACNYISWDDHCAYCDWAGMRPMTELEFEKACRGSGTPIANEFVWGTDTYYTPDYFVLNDGAANATVINPGTGNQGNAMMNETVGALAGPLRGGVFAASFANPTRVNAGATYWGIMEMGGNLYEPVIKLRTANSSYNYDGVHGDGTLTATGEDDVVNWPNSGGRRGGTYNYDSNRMRMADRQQCESNPAKNSEGTCRGIITAP
jgi:formylglycine-generating enzyme required for sulfatase activity